MTIYYAWQRAKQLRLTWLLSALLATGLLPTLAHAQAPALTRAITVGTASGGSNNDTRAVAADGGGNLYIIGNFSGSLTLGTTTLTSSGSTDVYVAKYVVATNTWAWAIRAGGTSYDIGAAVAVRNGSVYLTGSFTNNAQNAYAVTFSGAATPSGSSPQYGAAVGQAYPDMVVAKYVDNGTSATLAWTQVAGGKDSDYGSGIAVSGTHVYVVGTVTNDQANSQGVLLGGSGTAAGTAVQYGTSAGAASRDLWLVSYTDQGSSAAVAWTQVLGGTGYDGGSAVAVGNGGVYVTGSFTNDLANSKQVVAGGTGTNVGTSVQLGASSSANYNALLAKYVDNGTSATVAWTQTGGCDYDANGSALAVVGSSVYMAGDLYNDLANSGNAHFGGSGTTLGTVVVPGATAQASHDLLLVKYVDHGTSATLGWAQTDGGTAPEFCRAVAAVANHIYFTTGISNNVANVNGVLFGGGNGNTSPQSVSGVATAVSGDVVVAAYLDEGNVPLLDWVRVAGGPAGDAGTGLATAGTVLYAVGAAVLPATFGSFTLSAPTSYAAGFLTEFGGAAPLATMPGTAAAGLQVFPNPTAGQARLQGATPGASVHVFDALGRRVATATADATGAAALPAGLAPGLYLVRTGASTVRWAVE